jgi:hypothetical protein
VRFIMSMLRLSGVEMCFWVGDVGFFWRNRNWGLVFRVHRV